MKSNNRKGFLYQLWVLGKLKIAIPVSLSALTGYILQKRSFDEGFLYTFIGVFLLACGSMALNQVQERDLDARMPRTAGRPIPSGSLSLLQSLIIALLFILSGSLVLFLAFRFSWYPLMFGWLTILWYNAVYTPMKRRSAFAVLPGAVVGGLPPVIGWLAGGGNLDDHRIWLVAFFFFIGQIPHFWLLMLTLGNEYEKAGLPTLQRTFNEMQIRRLTFIWIFWSAIVSLFLAFFGVLLHLYAMLALLIGSLITVILFLPLIIRPMKKFNFRAGFIQLNLFYLLVIFLLCIDSLLT